MSDAPPVEVTIREITELVRLFEQTGWSSLELDIHGMHLVLGKDGVPTGLSASADPAVGEAAVATAEPPAVAEKVSPAAAPVVAPPPAAPTPTGPTVPAANAVEVRSPVVGAFWVAPSPGEPPFAQVGDRVEAGQQLAIVEVMKLMSDVSAPVAGLIVEVRASNAEMVEYDQVLFLIDPDG